MQAGQLLTKMNHAFAAFSSIDQIMSIESRDEKTKDYKGVNLDNGEITIKSLNYNRLLKFLLYLALFIMI